MDDGEYARYTGRLPQVAAPDHMIRGRKVPESLAISTHSGQREQKQFRSSCFRGWGRLHTTAQ